MTPPDPPEKTPPSPLSPPAVGLEFAMGIIVLGFCGWLADGWIGWRDLFPVCLVAGIFLGFGWGVWRLQKHLNRRDPPPRQ